MSYYNYHAQAKQLISQGHLIRMEIVKRWNSISPALVLYFDNHRPMHIREYRWDEYFGYSKDISQSLQLHEDGIKIFKEILKKDGNIEADKEVKNEKK